MKDNNRLARLDLSGVSHSLHAREIVVNALGRRLLSSSRSASEPRIPTLLVLDEAHQFVGKEIGGDDNTAKLDAFELIAKEGRKYGLSICLATQRPRDVTEGVLSQMGTLIVHRLTNDKDREVVERACGEIDKAATAILPNLRPGEAAIIGVDFPIPLKLSITEPTNKPESRGPDFQGSWGKAEETGKEEENGQKQEQQPSDEQASVNQAQQQDGKEQRPETEQAAYSDDVPF